MVRYCDKEHKDWLYFEFGKPDESKTQPTFSGYAIVELSEFCDVIMDDVIGFGKPKQGNPVRFEDRLWFDHILFNNCNIPYTYWYHYSMSPEKLEAKRKEAIREHSYSFDGGIFNVISRRTNAMNCYVTKLPNYNRISVEDKNFATTLKKRYDTCYAVEFHRLNQIRGVYMLFFVNSKYSRCIDSYIDQMSHYISFDENFTLE